MTDQSEAPLSTGGKILIHPLTVRFTHWVNALAMLSMILTGGPIYNDDALFAFKFPAFLTRGGWLAGALQWHFAAMWLLVLNGLIYIWYGIFSGHFKASFLPVTPKSVWREFVNALHGRIPHE